jgi:hypothetical protein
MAARRFPVENTGTLIVARINGKENQFVILLVSIQKGCILESSTALTEDDLRVALAKNSDETHAQIDERIALARAQPGI